MRPSLERSCSAADWVARQDRPRLGRDPVEEKQSDLAVAVFEMAFDLGRRGVREDGPVADRLSAAGPFDQRADGSPPLREEGFEAAG
ncbi:MAG: hypothetical protein C0501_18415 [Isosphaera sp.]|nr:hypothetical protein [Isosphaera sp.]